jgi:hypothetical protein
MPGNNSIMACPTKFPIIKIIMGYNISSKTENRRMTNITVEQFLMCEMGKNGRWFLCFLFYLRSSLKLHISRNLVRRGIQNKNKRKKRARKIKVSTRK